MVKRYKQPPIGTKLPGKDNDLPYPNANDQDGVNAYLQAQAQQMAFNHNELMVGDYAGTFDNWYKYLYSTGRVPYNAKPPQPPAAFMAVLVQGEAGVYWDQQQIGPPVCKVPAYKKLPKPQH